jgi:hypothetical protein
MRTPRSLLAIPFLLPLLQVPAQKPSPPPSPIERATAWPALDGEAEAQVETDVQRLRKASTPEMASGAEAGLLAAGAGAVPLLLPTLAHEKDPEALKRIDSVLLRLTDARHTRLLAAGFTDKSPIIRGWCLRRCAAFPDAELRAQAEAALAVLTKPGKKPEREELYAAALCVVSTGNAAGLAHLTPFAVDEWGKRGGELRAALEAVRSPEAAAVCAPLVESKDRKQIVGGLNLLAGCGDPGSVARVRPFLDSTDNSIRVAAINAMRGIVDGDPPLDKLAVFEAIEMAKEWKTRG